MAGLDLGRLCWVGLGSAQLGRVGLVGWIGVWVGSGWIGVILIGFLTMLIPISYYIYIDSRAVEHVSSRMSEHVLLFLGGRSGRMSPTRLDKPNVARRRGALIIWHAIDAL